MRTILIIFLGVFLGLNSSFGQKIKVDSVYYLLDTSRNNNKDSMWKIEDDEPVTYCILQCPCLKNGDMPIFQYSSNDNNNWLVDKQKLSSYQLVKLPQLAVIAKKTLEMRTGGNEHIFFLIVPEEGRYKIRKAKLSQTKTVN